jgi:hypothetical protein
MNYYERLASQFHGESGRWVGIPDNNPVFCVDDEIKAGEFTFIDGQLFSLFRDSSANKNNKVFKINRFTGEVLATADIGPLIQGFSRPHPDSCMIHNSRYLAHPPYLVDMESMEVVYDLSNLISDSGYKIGLSSGLLSDRYWIHEVDRKEHPGLWCVVDLKSMQGSLIETAATSPFMNHQNRDNMICIAGGELQIRKIENNQILSRRNFDGLKGILSRGGGAVAFLKEREIYLSLNDLSDLMNMSDDIPAVNYSGWCKLDHFSPLLIKVTEPECQLVVYHWRQQKVLWQKVWKGCQIRGIAGDLIFLLVNREGITEFIAIDKWTGELVWKPEGSLAVGELFFHGRQIYMTCCFEDQKPRILCLQWRELYQSPGRPKSPSGAWIHDQYENDNISLMDNRLVEPDPTREPINYQREFPPCEWIYWDDETSEKFAEGRELGLEASVISPDGKWQLMLYQTDFEYMEIGPYLVLKNTETGNACRLKTHGNRVSDNLNEIFHVIRRLAWNESGITLWERYSGFSRITIDFEKGIFGIEELGLWDDDYQEFWVIMKKSLKSPYEINRFRYSNNNRTLERMYAVEYWPFNNYAEFDNNIESPADLAAQLEKGVFLSVNDQGTAELITSTVDEAFTQEVLEALASGALTLPVGLEGDDLGGKLRVVC